VSISVTERLYNQVQSSPALDDDPRMTRPMLPMDSPVNFTTKLSTQFRLKRVGVALVAAALAASLLGTTHAIAQQSGSAMTAQMLSNFEKRTMVKTLPNGLTVILCERPEAPVFSFFRMVDAGSANDPGGESGLAHMFEHIAFKGTQEIGTTNWPAEKQALADVETAYAAYDHEKRLPVGSDPAKVEELHKKFLAAEDKAQTFVVPNEFSEIAEQNGAVGLNAETAEDETEYFWSMPSNRLELWAYLESSRIKDPVAREFYKERDVVQEERRMRIDSAPIGRMVEQFLATAYVAHPYGRSGVGWESEISQVTATEAAAFYKKYYTPSNMVISVVGDFKNAEMMPVIEKYFGAIPPGPKPEEMTTVEPPQFAEKSVIIREQTQPFYLEGYHRPDYRDKDDAVYNAISSILSDGRTSRLYRSLVRDQGIAAEAEGFSGFPGDKYAGLFAFYAVPLPGHSPDEMRSAIHKEIDRLKNEDVTDDELQMVKTRARANLLRGLDENQGIAEQLATYQMRYGDWRELFHELDKIDAVTKADIRRVSTKVFVESNRTYSEIETVDPKAQPAGNGGTK
jgi:predicted Zn-dependent peptidase